MALTPGLLLSDRYRLTERIAVGGMGEVWAADDGRLGRRIAVKILKSELTSDTEFVDRFRTEARITASLNHSGIASVYDYGEVASIAGGPRDTAFLVMELVSGEPLSAVLARQKKISVPRVLDVLEQSGRALQVAHLRSLVHRDIKPGNIMVTPAGQVKITDFGIAKAAYQVPITQGGMVMGTAQYLSPEQAAGHDAVPASDIYALGIVAFESLAGERPFQADSPVEIASMQVNNAPPPLPADVPPMIAALIMRMLAKDPRSRFADGAALAEAVAQVRAGRTVLGSAAGSAPTTVVGPLSGPIGAPGPSASAAHAAQAVHDAQVRVSHGLAPMPRRVLRRTGVSWAIGLTILLLAVAAGWYLAHRAGTSGDTAAVLLLMPVGRAGGRFRRIDLGQSSSGRAATRPSDARIDDETGMGEGPR